MPEKTVKTDTKATEARKVATLVAARQAQSAIADARRTAAELRAAIVSGDATITAAALSAAELDIVRAELFSEGARQRAIAAHEQHRVAQVAEIRRELADTYRGHHTEILARVDAAAAAVDELAAHVEEHNAGIPPLVHRLLELAPIPGDIDPRTDSGAIRIGEADVSIEPIDVRALLAEVADPRSRQHSAGAPGTLTDDLRRRAGKLDGWAA